MGSAHLRVTPVYVRFLGSLRVHIPPKPLGELPFAGCCVSHRPKQFADGASDERVCVSSSRSTQYVAAVQELASVFGDKPCFSGGVHQPLEQFPLQPSLQQLAPEVAQNGRIEALIFEPYSQGMFPS